jgi:hypothetical protein
MIFPKSNLKIGEKKLEFSPASSRNFQDLPYKGYHISVAAEDFSKYLTIMNPWDVKLAVRIPFLEKVHNSAL